LFSSAHAIDKEVVGDVAMEVSGGDLSNLTINSEVVAKYLNDELEKRTIAAQCWLTASRRRQRPRISREASKTTSTARKCWACNSGGDFVSQLATAATRALPLQANQNRNAPQSKARHVAGINSKTASPFWSQTIQISIHPFSSFPPRNAIKKIAHRPAARIRSTTKVCIFKISFLISALTYGPAKL
jgi:hypothetical protein